MRIIRDEFELPDDDDDGYAGYRVRRPRRSYTGWLFLVTMVIVVVAGVYLTDRITSEQGNDRFCLECHTVPEQTYYERADLATSGALAVDLSSFHYQTLRGQNSIIHCIDCHRGTGSLQHQVDVLTVGTRHALTWMIGLNDTRIEKGHVSAPQLANDSCLACHVKTLMVAGQSNHWHNMLVATYELWRAGAPIIPPPGSVDKQAVIASGLSQYYSSLTCADCHQAHASLNENSSDKSALSDVPSQAYSQLGSVMAAQAMGESTTIRPSYATHLETDQYLDKQIHTPEKCTQCHREVGKGPDVVTIP